jgi:hypothetical protein
MVRRLVLTFVLVLAIALTASYALGRFVFGHPADHPHQAQRASHSRHLVSAVKQPKSSSNDGLATAAAHLGMIMSKKADLGTVGSGATAVHLLSVPTSRGGSCLVAENPDGSIGVSCLDTPSLFTNAPVAYLELSDGGPDPATIKYDRIVGVAKPGVSAVEVQLSSGKTAAASVISTGAFDYEVPLSTVHAGSHPSKLIAHEGGQVAGTIALSR